MPTRLRSRIILLVFLFCVLLAATAVAGIAWFIDQGVEDYIGVARKAFPQAGDDVAALMALARSGKHSLYERNHAVWALGRIADPRALPVLQAAYTGEPCKHGKFLCQYELSKAIKRCGGTPSPRLAQAGH